MPPLLEPAIRRGILVSFVVVNQKSLATPDGGSTSVGYLGTKETRTAMRDGKG
jgi:hypothetical protein